MLPAPALLAVGLALALIVLIPARRLHLAGFRSRSVALYAACLWALAFVLAIWPAATRFLVPILVVAYVAPFVVAPERLARIVRRGGGGGAPPAPPLKNVTPPDPPAGVE